MATDAELKEFDQADGKAGRKTYPKLMTANHQGAIRMAQTEAATANPDAIKLAMNIITTQQQEIGVMKDLLAKV